MASKTQVQNCIKTIAPLAQAEYKKGKKILPSVCIAQACCESAYLTSPKMVRANAVFGIKVGKSKVHFGKAWKDKAYSTKTKECYDGKTYVAINDMFRAYDTIQESVEDYYDMLCACSRYKAAVGAKTAKDTITAIKNGGYATSPTYINTIMNIIKSYDLTKYDGEPAVVPCYPKYTGHSISIVMALNSLGIDSSKDSRKRIAQANGIVGYKGTSAQNTKLLTLLKEGKLKK